MRTRAERHAWHPRCRRSWRWGTRPTRIVSIQLILHLWIRPTSTDLKNGTLPSFAFIEAGYGRNDEHPGSGQSILFGQTQVASLVGSLMSSPEWKDSVFFVSYDEGGGPYDHVPPVPGHSNDFTSASMGAHIRTFRRLRSIPTIRTVPVRASQRGTGDAALRPGSNGPRSQSRRCCCRERIRRAARLPGAEHGYFAVHPAALRVAHPDGSHGGHQVCREPLYWKLGAPDAARCGAAQPAGLFRLHQCSVGHTADSANAGNHVSLHTGEFWAVSPAGEVSHRRG